MPRRNHRRVERPELDEERARQGFTVVTMADGRWSVRRLASATKAYRCPGCDHEIAVGVGHVVAWPTDDLHGADERRHWHTGCWQARLRASR